MADFYVYILFRRDGTPFYVGMGRGNRWTHHERPNQLARKSYKSHIIREILSAGLDLPKIKVRENLSYVEAIETEIALVAAIGRRPAGPLVNQCRGGEGIVDPSAEIRAYRSAVQKRLMADADARDRIRNALLGRPLTPEHRAKISAGGKGILGRKKCRVQLVLPLPK